ncbi:hydantoinase/oxoprolinase N-terminal domain-containing protein [Halocatena marina]|uniref:hydantoinase/oxoprolinase N-terminal domain-containing protein n=1 Tax=Halocatena marina TaxID=2934937 RepID=UPI00361FF729
MTNSPTSDWLAVDIGGTFVDAITFDRESGNINIEKAATTPTDPTQGVLNSSERVDASLENTTAFVHGTTLGLNAVLERKGARTGIITNTGFRDVYEIGRTNLERSAMYDINYEKPESLVPRRRCKEVLVASTPMVTLSMNSMKALLSKQQMNSLPTTGSKRSPCVSYTHIRMTIMKYGQPN